MRNIRRSRVATYESGLEVLERKTVIVIKM